MTQYCQDVGSLIREAITDSQHRNPKHNMMLREKHERKVKMLGPEDRAEYDRHIEAMRQSMAS